jgi:hypothetical protein
LLDAGASSEQANQGTRDSSRTKPTEGQAGTAHSVRRAALSIHVGCSARNPPRHHANVQTLDHTEGLADQGAYIRPAKSAAPEAFEEAGVIGKMGMKSVGLFAYDKSLDEHGIEVNCEVKVFPLLVKRQSEAWPEFEQRLVQLADPVKAVSLIKEPGLKKLVATFTNRVAASARKSAL